MADVLPVFRRACRFYGCVRIPRSTGQIFIENEVERVKRNRKISDDVADGLLSAQRSHPLCYLLLADSW